MSTTLTTYCAQAKTDFGTTVTKTTIADTTYANSNADFAIPVTRTYSIDYNKSAKKTAVADTPKTTSAIEIPTTDWANDPAETDFQTNETSLVREL